MVKKIGKEKFWKRSLAILLAASMGLTTNAFGMNAATVYAAEKLSEDIDSLEAETPTTVDESKEANEEEIVINKETAVKEEETTTENADGISIASESEAAAEEGEDASESDSSVMTEMTETEEMTQVSEKSETADVLKEETAAAENYRAIVFADETEFEKIKENPNILWEGGYDEKWESGENTEALLNDLSSRGLYACIEPCNPEIANCMLTIPANMKGIIVTDGWYEDENGGGICFDFVADTLDIKGSDTCVYFVETGVDTGDEIVESNTFEICFSEKEDNRSKVFFKNCFVNAVIHCASENGTIVFRDNNIINGYQTKTVTEFQEDGNLLIRKAYGLSFEQIIGDYDASIVFNGYPEDTAYLPHFNQGIDLGTGIDEESGEEYDRSVTIRFWEYKEIPFWLLEDDWWESQEAVSLEKGTQIAYFAGVTRSEKERIGSKVSYYAHGDVNNDLYLDAFTGKLERDGEETERGAYAVLKLADKAAYDAVTEDVDLIFGEESEYYDLWDETDTLDDFLNDDSIEYVVIQATQASHALTDKTLELPANIKGAVLVSDWNEEAQTSVDWQLDTLKTTGGTQVYINGLNIDTADKDFRILSGNNADKIVFNGCVINAAVVCASEDTVIGFLGDTILNGYQTKGATEFGADAKLLIREAAGLSFEEITGDGEAMIIFNGYPEDTAYLPYFNGEISLGTGIDEETQKEYDQTLTLRFWQRQETPFWLAESEEDWWEAVDAVPFEKGTQIAYFVGATRNEKERIGSRVSYYAHGDANVGLYLNTCTGRLEKDGEETERGAYAVLKLENKTAYDAITENIDLIFGEESEYYDLWDETDTLDDFLNGDGIEYVVIQATQASHALTDKTLELPANIKGAILVSDWNEEEQKRVAWQLDAIRAAGETQLYLGGVDIDPTGQTFAITAEAQQVSAVISDSEIMGSISAAGIAELKFKNSAVNGTITLDGSGAVVIEEMLVADGLSGYASLNVNGDTLFIVRNPEAVVIENSTFTKTGEEQGFNLLYNGYPENASALPVFNDNIVIPEEYGFSLRFVQRSEDVFWEQENWWEEIPDEVLPMGTQIAATGIAGEELESLVQRLFYYTNDEEHSQNVSIVANAEGKLLIQRYSESGKQIVDFVLSANTEKEYDGKAFAISADMVTNQCDYNGSVELVWETKEGTVLSEAPKDAGEYVLKMRVPDDTEGFEGETKTDVIIKPKTVTVSIKPNTTPTGYEIVWDGFIDGDTYVEQAEVERGNETADNNGKYCMVGTKGGDAGKNYSIVHADAVRIDIAVDEAKPVINSVVFPKNKESYVYTGEQIRPEMVVSYQYTDGTKQKTQKLKLNVDYTLMYANNVNVTDAAHTAKVTVRGIGEYSGLITKDFSITPKSIKKVTLSAVGDVVFGTVPTVTVTDGIYELVEGTDYDIVLSTEGAANADTQSVLKVKGKGNYNEESQKSVKFNILQTSTTIKSIASEDVKVEFKKLKSYTYSGKANKPAVVVTDNGVKVPTSQYKVIYSKNVDAGTQTASVRVVGVSKKGKGYYGVSEELKFDIKRKDFSKVSVSSIAAVPKTEKLAPVTMTVKDGKHILTEGVDYTVDYSKITDKDGTIKSNIAIGQKCEVTLNPIGKNYTSDSKKTVYVKFGQLNLASKTANISVEIKNAAQNEVEVVYNGVLLNKDTDYTAQVKADKNKPTYTVTIKAVKGSAYKGKKVLKNRTVGVEEETAKK